ncbi:MAG: glycogen-binding domain-containing protein [Gemmatimonadetes bacterium]|nr:glycogen-binding domain-containing protein [Gemmatimonadota bacterium]
MRSAPASLVVVILALAGPAPALSQSEVTIELGASQVGPPSGVDAATARFAVGGVRASTYSSNGSGLFASVLAGRSFGATSGGDFLSGTLGGTLRQDWGRGWTGGFDVRALGFEVRAPFPYRALAAEGGPTLRYRSGQVSVKVNGLAGIGTSRLQLRRRPDTPVVRTIDHDLWRVGGTTELLVGSGNTWFGLEGGAHHTSGGTYTAGGLRLILGGTQAAAELRVDVWDTPGGTETTGGLAIVIPVSGRWTLRGFLGRSEPDPMTLAEPGSGSGGLLLGRTVYRGGTTTRRASLYQIVGSTDTGARVRISVVAPATATRVEVMGDFSLWDAVPMLRDGDRWTVVLEIGNGTYHFGFLVDGEWFVPDDASDVVPDEWGRRNATLVIEGVGS